VFIELTVVQEDPFQLSVAVEEPGPESPPKNKADV
jgi:hypothetical protein